MINASADLNLRIAGLLIAQLLDARPQVSNHLALSSISYFTSISDFYLNLIYLPQSQIFTSISGFVFTGSVSFFVPMGFSSQYEEHFGKLFAKLFLTLSSARIWDILVLISF